jgi:hypothetical protein
MHSQEKPRLHGLGATLDSRLLRDSVLELLRAKKRTPAEDLQAAAPPPKFVGVIAARRLCPTDKLTPMGTALQDLQGTINPTTGVLSTATVQTTGATGAGAGIINWATFFSLLRLGGYSGPAEAQIEYSITGAKGTSVSLNNAFFADDPQFTSGNLTPAIMTASMKIESDFYRQRALAGGGTATQIT